MRNYIIMTSTALLLLVFTSGCQHPIVPKTDSMEIDYSELTKVDAVVEQYLHDGYWFDFGGGTSDLAVLTIVYPESYKNRIEICVLREQRKSTLVLRNKGAYVQFYMSKGDLQWINNPVSRELFGPLGVEDLKGLEEIEQYELGSGKCQGSCR